MWNGFTWNGAPWSGRGALAALPEPPPPPAVPGTGTAIRFTWEGGEFAPSLMSRAWLPAIRVHGGRSVSAAGVPVAYLVRTDRLVALTLRVREEEWEAARAFLHAGQGHAVLRWYPDAANPEDEGVAVYLEEPSLGQTLTLQRLGEYPRVLEFSIILRAVSGPVWRSFY